MRGWLRLLNTVTQRAQCTSQSREHKIAPCTDKGSAGDLTICVDTEIGLIKPVKLLVRAARRYLTYKGRLIT